VIATRGTTPLARRYDRADLRVLNGAEAARFLCSGDTDPRHDLALAWELLYRLEPELYDRLMRAERLHPGILEWLPARVGRIVEVGAGSGRLTTELTGRCDHVVAVEPAGPLRRLLAERLPRHAGCRIDLVEAFFDDLPLPDGWAELVIACSAVTPDTAHGGDRGLREMERVCAHAGRVVVVWPNHLEWLAGCGYEHLSFAGEMWMDFGSPAEAVEMARIFFPQVADEVHRRGVSRVPYEMLGVNPPRDLAVKEIRR
jgi:SAM-dependent methyltransferase